ncbi:hypothetical protein XAC3810_240316 [Xanthomonas citri pv. citri]|uniref:Uncharacterized protein n=1 Tax=Xanthomonas citri pv. citri TaxID=611301 RepID=A0A0U5FBK9_XANCI|nr:hypothetical protein XAC3824_240159 [Xanthomonas citri pv. citri]CEE21035.1 hypothetical protein XAC9322_230161 [Xanthomonas citri pv. citri]CEE22485.1 hypothetical protein XAC1083_220317 [Xanthomonas citri pv. citri]CEE30838.1 hypothetical protein XAC3810_240316 [Xanthomonas citri pv. citri]CEE33526.1 hypothetical protein XAC902_300148 [Xanthomonas citri pv. citri]
MVTNGNGYQMHLSMMWLLDHGDRRGAGRDAWWRMHARARTRARVRIHTSEMRKMQNAQNAEGMRAQLPFPRRDIVSFIGEQGARRADEGGCEA